MNNVDIYTAGCKKTKLNYINGFTFVITVYVTTNSFKMSVLHL